MSFRQYYHVLDKLGVDDSALMPNTAEKAVYEYIVSALSQHEFDGEKNPTELGVWAFIELGRLITYATQLRDKLQEVGLNNANLT